MTDLKTRLTDLYRGTDSASVRFRYGLIGFDAITILFFMSTAHIPHGPWLIGLSWLAGPRVCTGAGFAMIEGPLILSMILQRFRVEPVAEQDRKSVV